MGYYLRTVENTAWMREPWQCPHCGKKGVRGGGGTHESFCAKQEERLWSKIDKNGPNGCWIWTSYVNSWGYGATSWSGKKMVAVHRMLYQREHRVTLTKKQFCLHRCDEPRCVNPAHIWIGNHADNMRDMLNKGRSGQTGERNIHAVLTEAKVREIRAIRERDGLNYTELAKQYGVYPGTIREICLRLSWKHVQ